jgi:polyisoprenyl-phosphate glycosyltransferase
MTNFLPAIGIVLPCFNEQQMIPNTAQVLHTLLDSLVAKGLISDRSFIGFIDDGSRDQTWKIIEKTSFDLVRVKGLKLAANAGHQKALLAGLMTYKDEADALISMDADLQDDILVIEEMIKRFTLGADVVYGVRKQRQTDTWFKKNTALLFYRLMRVFKVNIIFNHADFRLQSRRSLDALAQFGEVNLFLRGIVPSIGFEHEVVYYDRLDRAAGESKYPLRKMLSFAWNGITSFSSVPLKFVTFIGFAIFLGCLIMSIYALWALYYGSVVPGWVSTVLPMYFLGGIQLFCIGILGEYIGKIYAEVKQRPRYIIDKRVG